MVIQDGTVKMCVDFQPQAVLFDVADAKTIVQNIYPKYLLLGFDILISSVEDRLCEKPPQAV